MTIGLVGQCPIFIDHPTVAFLLQPFNDLKEDSFNFCPYYTLIFMNVIDTVTAHCLNLSYLLGHFVKVEDVSVPLATSTQIWSSLPRHPNGEIAHRDKYQGYPNPIFKQVSSAFHCPGSMSHNSSPLPCLSPCGDSNSLPSPILSPGRTHAMS